MPSPHPDGLSGNQIKRAGKLLRHWLQDVRARTTYQDGTYTHDDVLIALGILHMYRKRFTDHPQPLNSVSMSLRSITKTATGRPGEISQRLKRAERIVEKLVRHPHMQLTTMDDIAGCRVVVENLDHLKLLRRRCEKTWGANIKLGRDYVNDPKPTGYRAYHLVVMRKGMPVEVQIRTELQQQWAESVEQAELGTRSQLKDGQGDAEILDMFRLIGEAFGYQDRAEPIPADLRERIAAGTHTFRTRMGLDSSA